MKLIKALKKIWQNKKGFTIVELMAVFAILAVIAAIAVPQFTGTVNKAKEKTDKASAIIIARAAEQKWIDDGETGEKEYKASDLAGTGGYLKENPKAQNDSATDWFITVDATGKCTGVYYGDEATGTNLIDKND